MTSEFQRELAALKQRIEGNMPPTFVQIMHRAIRDLEASGIQNRVLKPGAMVPDFELRNQDGVPRKAAELYGSGPLVITFYRGFWCPYCNADLANLKKYVPAIEEAGGKIIAISPEKQEYSRKIIVTRKLNFEILTDEGNQVAEQFGLKFALSPDMKALYQDDFNINLKLYHGDDDWTLPIPARFVVRSDGVIVYAESSPDYKQRPDPAELMPALQSMR